MLKPVRLSAECYDKHFAIFILMIHRIYVAICEKVALRIEEVAEYSNIGQNRISSLLKEPRCPFVLYVGTKKLVKRKKFKKFISENIEI